MVFIYFYSIILFRFGFYSILHVGVITVLYNIMEYVGTICGVWVMPYAHINIILYYNIFCFVLKLLVPTYLDCICVENSECSTRYSLPFSKKNIFMLLSTYVAKMEFIIYSYLLSTSFCILSIWQNRAWLQFHYDYEFMNMILKIFYLRLTL